MTSLLINSTLKEDRLHCLVILKKDKIVVYFLRSRWDTRFLTKLYIQLWNTHVYDTISDHIIRKCISQKQMIMCLIQLLLAAKKIFIPCCVIQRCTECPGDIQRHSLRSLTLHPFFWTQYCPTNQNSAGRMKLMSVWRKYILSVIGEGVWWKALLIIFIFMYNIAKYIIIWFREIYQVYGEEWGRYVLAM